MDSEKTIREQQQLASEIERLLENFGKDGPSRKTKQYLIQKRMSLEKLWQDFIDNHALLEAYLKGDHPYVVNDLFGITQKIYHKALNAIVTWQEKGAVKTTSKAAPAISDVQKLTEVALADYSLPKAQDNAISNAEAAQTDYTFPKAEDKPIPVAEAPRNFPQPATLAFLNNYPKLPPIKIPKFNGDYKEWKPFIDIFCNVIHNNPHLSNVEKMQYLVYHLEGDARKVISHLQLCTANYQTAFCLIQARFNNNRRIITSYVNTIMDLNKVEHRSQDDIIMLYDTLKECLEALKALRCQTDNWGPIIVCIIIRKLDNESLRIFEETLSSPREMPTIEELLLFLEKRYQVLDCIRNSKQSKVDPTHNKKRTYHTSIKKGCILCNNDHGLYHCPDFKKMSIEDRLKFVTKKSLCENCLSHKQDSKCLTKKSCFYCHKKHHTLLHLPDNQTNKKLSNHNRVTTNHSKEGSPNIRQDNGKTKESPSSHHAAGIPSVLLPTAMVKVVNAFGQKELLRALVDPGSQVSLITEEAAQNLRLPKERIKTTISGVGDSSSTKSNSKVNVTIQTKDNGCLQFAALVLKKLSSVLPDCTIPKPDYSKFKNIVLADPTFDQPQPIDLLLGADVYANIIREGFIAGQPAAQKTSLGWILFGGISKSRNQVNKVSSFISLAEMDKKLEEFWEMDSDTPSIENTATFCEEHYNTTHKRDSTGRYIVKLPFKNDANQLGYSKGAAIARLLHTEGKLSKDPSQQEEYNNFLREYLQLGHMSPSSSYKGEERKVFYLPHHAVIKADSSTTKLRVVFDASCKSSSNLSLNDCLHSGPNIQQELRKILLRWRIHRYVFTADIEKMFRQIKIAHKDKNFQRILWRERPSDPIQEFKLNTVTYGTGPATFLAIRTLKQLATDEGSNYPIGKIVLNNDFYVDDMLSGADTKEEARLLQEEIISLLKKGCFNLRKWTSNNQELLKPLPENLIETGVLEIGKDDTIKTLGIHWNPLDDLFHYKINLKNENAVITKRSLASKIASIFDPLGFLAPITITAKLIMQSLCKENVDWDASPSADVAKAWHKLETEMQELKLIKIPRWVYHRTTYEMELHGFCDASEKAHAAAIYSRTTDSFGKVHVALLTAKTRVTPLKQKPTLPRLELCGALLLARLLKSTLEALALPTIKTYAWCDSEIVLAWITKNPANLDTYISNRVREIQELNSSTNCIWNHVASLENPADVASRGIRPNKLSSHALWWRGPLWLSQSSEAWPSQKLNVPLVHCSKRDVTMFTRTSPTPDFLSCSTYTKQLRVIAYCRRFAYNCKTNSAYRMKGFLTASEIQASRICLIKMVQTEDFSTEIKLLCKNKPLPKTSKLTKLHPFLDSDGLLRVGGRIQNSALSMDAKHQVLLPSKHQFSNMIIEHAHQQTLHGGVQQTLSNVRNKYWIIDGKRRVQSRINKCIRCLRHRTDNKAPLMGNLPTVRVTPAPPFSHVGIDYAGPFLTKMSKSRSNTSTKGYVALFVCMVTKAVHLELVTELTTDAFLAAYKRFVARRGIPKEINTDNGTNFVGAKNKLHQDLLVAIKESNKRTAELTAADGTEWKFIPAASPHFGGLWEAAVKSMKHHLKRILSDTLLTYEEFSTILVQVEGCLNSRPIGQHSSDPSDLEPLTPGHFLIGRPILAPPEPDISNQNAYQRWKLLTKIYQNIWKRWSQEYLSSLQQRTKWTTDGKNPAIGELVLLKEDNLIPQKWPLGRIVELHPGEDGVVRIVSVQFKNIVKKRPLVKLCQLPLNTYSSQMKEEDSVVISNIITKGRNTTPPHSESKVGSKAENRQRTKRREDSPSYDYSTSKKRRTRVLPCTWATSLFAALSFLQFFTLIFSKQYEIIKPSPGYYIENLGSAQIKRGNLRIQITYPVEQLIEDLNNVNSTWTQVDEMCDKARRLTQITHCEELLRHLSFRKELITKHIQEILQRQTIKTRSKRGVLGKLLTTIFGVNDEVYTDIENLQHNQQDLLYSQNQHMLFLDTKLNQTNLATMEKLRRFDLRLSQVVSTINDMDRWFRITDHNRIAIETLATYLSAEDYFDEVSDKYNNLLNAVHHQTHLLKFLSLHDIKETIVNASEKLGPNFVILPTPQERIQAEVYNDSIKVYGYLNIVERSSYDLIHVTFVPKLIKNNILLVSDAEASTFAVNLNSQTYFTLTAPELRSCSSPKEHFFICSPTVINDVQHKPSCIIDELYDRYPKTTCSTHPVKLTGTIWKTLMMKNTWLFIANQTITAAIFCSGLRHEERLNGTGIIHLNEGCYVKTKEVTLKPTIESFTEVINSHIKHFTPIAESSYHEESLPELKPGLLLKANEQLVTYTSTPYFHPTHLRKALLTHSLSVTAIIITITTLLIIAKYWNILIKFCCCGSRKNKRISSSQDRNDCPQTSVFHHFDRVLGATTN